MTRVYLITICDDCINLKGQMCHEPTCIFCRRTMEEVGEYLNTLLIRPIIDGERFDVEYAFSLPVKDPRCLCSERYVNVDCHIHGEQK